MPKSIIPRILNAISFASATAFSVLSIYATTNKLSSCIVLSFTALLYVITIVAKCFELRYEKRCKDDCKIRQMELLLQHLYASLKCCESDDVTITVHRKLNDREYIRYTHTITSSGKRDDINAKFFINKGIIRLAFERHNGKDVFVDSFADINEKKEKLVKEYRYTEDEAENMLQDQRSSYYCRPITRHDKIWGAIYITSTNRHFFQNKSGQLRLNKNKIVKSYIKLIQNELL